MSTMDNVELTIVTVVLTIFFLLLCFFIIELIRTLLQIRRVTKKAESFISNAKTAAETLTSMGKASKQNFPLLRIFAQILDNTINRKNNGSST